MKGRLRRSVIPLYVLLCILLGGSSQGIWNHAVLQLIAVALIAWAALTPRKQDAAPASRQLLGLAALSVLVVLVQLVPLPPQLWTRLPGRELVVEGYNALGQQPPWLPISMTPYRTLASALALLPPVAVLVGILRLQAYEEKWLVGALLLGTLAAVLLGAVQVASGSNPAWYLYEITNDGAVGFFANRNHMGTLLLVAVPFAFALFATRRGQEGERARGYGMAVAGAAGLLLAIVGLALNHSLAAVSLGVPVVLLSALMLSGGWPLRRLLVPAAALALVAGAALFASSAVQNELAQGLGSVSFESRRTMWGRSMEALSDSFPLGTGIGSFRSVYDLYEDPATIDNTYVNRAHNDYLEFVLEGGLPAVLLILAFFAWWFVQAARVWRSPLSSHFPRAATIASGAIMAHSFVDYPLRTEALAATLAACVAIMAQRQRGQSGEDQPARHVAIG